MKYELKFAGKCNFEISISNDIFNGEMEQGDKKWSLRVGVESVLLKRLKWSYFSSGSYNTLVIPS